MLILECTQIKGKTHILRMRILFDLFGSFDVVSKYAVIIIVKMSSQITPHVSSRTIAFVLLNLVAWSIAEETTSATKPTNVAVYYDTTPASLNFLKDQVEPTLQKGEGRLYQRIRLTLVPYGASKHQYNPKSKTTAFDCGDSDCDLLKTNACLLRGDGRQSVNATTLSSVICLLNVTCKDARALNVGDDCDDTLSNFGAQTTSVKPEIVSFPAVVIDDAYNASVSASLVKDFELRLKDALGEGGSSGEATSYTYTWIIIALTSLLLILLIALTLYYKFRIKGAK